MKNKILAFVMALVLIAVPSFTVVNAADSKIEYTNYVTARSLSSGLKLSPTAVFEPSSFDDIPATSSGVTALVFTPDEDMYVTLNSVTKSFTDLFTDSLKGKFIPVLRLDSATVGGFIDMMTNTAYIADIMVISSDLSVLSEINSDSVATIANLVYDLTSVKIPADRYGTWEYIKEANKVYANILMFDASDENFAVAAEYLNAMSKVIWGVTDGEEETVSAIAAGSNGIILNDVSDYSSAIKYFSASGFSKAQYIAAHRGITAYCNQNTATAVAAAVSEGATHAEIDIQLCADGEIMICHDATTGAYSDTSAAFISNSSEKMKSVMLNDYSDAYGDSPPTLDEVIDAVVDSDLILIIELKLGDASTSMVGLEPIEKFLDVMEAHPEMDGRWFCITFYRPYAEAMRELAPEISVGFLGGAQSGYEKDKGISAWDGEWTSLSEVSSKIAFMHKFSVLSDESYSSTYNSLHATYMARGYLINSWTYNDVTHLATNMNIATTNAAEMCAMAIKNFVPTSYDISEEELSSGKVAVMTEDYCGWLEERECTVITVSKTSTTAKVLLYYSETVNGTTYGLYSQLLTYNIK